ncbi:hypothetical protein AB0M42_22785 [Streptomyces sp. NPDC051784]
MRFQRPVGVELDGFGPGGALGEDELGVPDVSHRLSEDRALP